MPGGLSGLEHGVTLTVGVGVLVRGVGPLELVQRRSSQVHVTVLDQRPHVAEQQGEQQGADVLTINIGIGHQHDLVIAQLGQIKLGANSGTESRDQTLNLRVGQGPVEPSLLHVQDLSADRHDRLRCRVTALHGATAGRVTLHDEHLRDGGVTAGAILELARHTNALEQALTASGLTRLARGHPGLRGLDRLTHDVSRLVRVRVQPVSELFVDHLLREGTRLGVTELCLGLALELGLA